MFTRDRPNLESDEYLFGFTWLHRTGRILTRTAFTRNRTICSPVTSLLLFLERQYFVLVVDSPGFIALSSSFQFPKVQISPEKDRFRCSYGFVKICNRSRKNGDLIFLVACSSG